MQQTLRIKRVYFEQIKAGKKNKEYRTDKPFYRSLFLNKNITEIVFFYSITSSERMKKRVEKLEIIETPKWLKEKEPKIFSGEKVFEISLKKGHEIFNKW